MGFVGLVTFAEVMQLCSPLVILSKRFSMIRNHIRNTSSVGRNKLLFKSIILVISWQAVIQHLCQ
jgi:hypothetical protein